MSDKKKIKQSEYATIMESARNGYKTVKRGKGETAESYTAKVWTNAVIGNLHRLGLIEFTLDLEELPYESSEGY